MPVVAPADPFVTGDFQLAPCLGCGKDIFVLMFPAQGRQGQSCSAGVAAGGEDSVCFHHPGKRAEVACEVCGRFLCGLCHVDFHGRVLCAACLTQMHTHSHKTKLTGNATSAHVPSRLRYDMLAGFCVLVAPLFTFVSFIPAGIALFLCIRFWKAPVSVIPRNRWRFVVAGVGACAILVFWCVMAVLGIMAVLDARHSGRTGDAGAQEEVVTYGDE